MWYLGCIFFLGYFDSLGLEPLGAALLAMLWPVTWVAIPARLLIALLCLIGKHVIGNIFRLVGELADWLYRIGYRL